MIQLTWDPFVAIAIALAGLMAGFVLGPQAWPLRTATHTRPPVALALVMSLSVAASFFVPLAVFRYAANETVELQATILSLVFALTGTVGLAIRGRL